MQLLGRLEISSHKKIAEFLSEMHVGRIATIDKDGYPQVIPMNFVFLNDMIYMHSHTKGEKLDNIKRGAKVGFEVDRELEFLPSYFTSPHDASVADTLYISVVIKGIASIVQDRAEKALALNALMKKYQPEGGYEPIMPDFSVLNHVSVIRIEPNQIRGKYKIGQTLPPKKRTELALNIYRQSPTATETLRIMGFEIRDRKLIMTDEPVW